ncbi:stage II sporulation protein M [Halorientalis brevis]|uniref:Stage II sporulation protein M n=1 Tax=Halorientalis brevis TaxID=1126241 RepID=A0ABD6C992_9EURY|nr:stage II sporulation protein M [Halorientalis brevis]
MSETPSSQAASESRWLPVRLWADYWRYVALSGALFAVGIVVGALLVDLVSLSVLFGGRELEGAFPEPTVGLLVVNNAIVILLLVASSLTLGLVTAAVLLYNGVIVGYVATEVAREGGLAVVLVGLLPHGVLEIPAFLFASAVAFRFTHQVLGAALGRREDVMTQRELREAAVMVVVALVLIPIAAFVEAEITTALLDGMRTG